MFVIVTVIVIVLSRGYDRGADIRLSYARTGCLVDMVRESTIREMGHLGIWLRESSICLDFDSVSFVYMVTGEFPYAWPWDCPLDSMLLLLCLIDVYDLMYIYMLSDVDMLL